MKLSGEFQWLLTQSVSFLKEQTPFKEGRTCYLGSFSQILKLHLYRLLFFPSIYMSLTNKKALKSTPQVPPNKKKHRKRLSTTPHWLLLLGVGFFFPHRAFAKPLAPPKAPDDAAEPTDGFVAGGGWTRRRCLGFAASLRALRFAFGGCLGLGFGWLNVVLFCLVVVWRLVESNLFIWFYECLAFS